MQSLCKLLPPLGFLLVYVIDDNPGERNVNLMKFEGEVEDRRELTSGRVLNAGGRFVRRCNADAAQCAVPLRWRGISTVGLCTGQSLSALQAVGRCAEAATKRTWGLFSSYNKLAEACRNFCWEKSIRPSEVLCATT